MERYEELLEKIREMGPVDVEEIKNEITRLSEEVTSLAVDLDVAEDFPARMVIIDKMMIDAKRMDELDSLNKAMLLYTLEKEQRKLCYRIWNLFRR